MNVKSEIEEILYKLGFSKEELVSRDYSTIGIFDSITMAELIMLVEERWNIEIDGEDIIPENFSNLDSISKLVGKYIVQ